MIYMSYALAKRVDFVVNTDFNWGIELARENILFLDHAKRFQNKYKTDFVDHAVINFITGTPKKAPMGGDRVYNVFFSEDFRRCRVDHYIGDTDAPAETYNISLKDSQI